MKPYEKYRIGSLEVEMIPVDHSIPGACGYIIYSDEGNMAYTGDLRFHGYVEDQSKDLSEGQKRRIQNGYCPRELELIAIELIAKKMLEEI
jgi:ribonuclease J